MLFEVKKYKPAEVPVSSAAGIDDDNEQLVAPSQKLIDVINLVDHGRTIHYVSNGEWSMHQMLDSLLQKTGPAEVWISSYAFSETPARVLSHLKGTIIEKLHCLIDSRVDVRSASALAMMRNTCDSLRLCHTHAKVTVLKNDTWFLCVAGSANYTTNIRYEVGMISCNPLIANFHRNWIENELTKI